MARRTRSSRRQRWRQTAAVNFVVFGAVAIFLTVSGAFLLALPCIWLCYSAAFDYRHGWRLRYDLPPWGRKQIKRHGIGGDVARAAWARTQAEGRNPNRQRYAFDLPAR